MANVAARVIKKEWRDKILTITEFRKKLNISYQTVAYAIEKGNIDYMEFSKSVRVIVLTDKTNRYKPNPHPKRTEKD